MKRSTPRQILGLSGLYLTMKPVVLEVSLAKYLYVTSPKIVEVLAAPELAADFSGVDVLQVTQALDSVHSSGFDLIIEDIKACLTDFLQFQNCHVRKTSNAAAHRLAKLVLISSYSSCWFDENIIIRLSISSGAKHDQMDEFLSNSNWRTAQDDPGWVCGLLEMCSERPDLQNKLSWAGFGGDFRLKREWTVFVQFILT
ncbi:hypothetical protein DVH24_036716 [Malus domestica]|uniref:RNase H type-1 domain-containing protein n=1 Tax=Malus domestica TaxID=3750 RepID=A0A498IJQ2_MALDO|nr:hypothetical protein DVH24_036716 [Malus domestica]